MFVNVIKVFVLFCFFMVISQHVIKCSGFVLVQLPFVVGFAVFQSNFKSLCEPLKKTGLKMLLFHFAERKKK